MKTVIAMCAAAWVVASAPLAASAQSVPSVEELVRSPDYSGLAISRNGRYMATTIPSNGRMNLAVIEVETRTRTTLTTHSDFDVIDIAWVGNDRLLYKLGRFESPDGSGEYEGGGLFMISRDGKQQLRLSETRRDVRRTGARAYRDIDFIRTLPGGDDEVMVRANLREVDSFDLYRMNITNGQTTLLTESRPERTYRYLLDRNRVPRVAISMPRDSNTVILHFRRDEKTPWQEALRYDRTKPGMVEPLFFESNNRTLIVASNRGRDNVAVFRWDPSAPDKAMELVFEHASLDLGADATGGRRAAGDVFVDATTEEVLGYTIQGERPQTVWNTEENRRPQRIVDRALPDTYNTIRRMRGNLHLVTARSDRWPATWHLWDESAGTIEDFLASRPWLMDRLVQMRPFTLTTRDGLQIPSYYLLPRSHKPGDRLPTVVHVHGGPHVRADMWGTYSYGLREAQVLAARGYAVVLPNFRGTPGFGNRVYYSAFGALGRQMLDDHEDAARWAVQQGFADADRICISGASYGGYAALMALARYPSTFKCGVAGLPVSDLELLLTSPAGDLPSSYAAVPFWRALIGVGPGQPIPRELSPVHLADRIKQPVMLYAGADDVRTPLEQTTRMVDALTRAGNPPRATVIKPGEGHGFGRPENKLELYDTMLKFLDAAIGPGRRG
jgi:dipeptidyl aminopeptidase/acylaminoacyl peptidase